MCFELATQNATSQLTLKLVSLQNAHYSVQIWPEGRLFTTAALLLLENPSKFSYC